MHIFCELKNSVNIKHVFIKLFYHVGNAFPLFYV